MGAGAGALTRERMAVAATIDANVFILDEVVNNTNLMFLLFNYFKLIIAC